MEWLNLQPHGLALFLAETPKLDYVVVHGQAVAECRDALAKAGYRTHENRPDLATRRVELDPDGAFLPGQAKVLEDLHAALPRARFASFSDARHRRPQDGVTPGELLARRATPSGMPRAHVDVMFAGELDEASASPRLTVDHWKGRYRFSLGTDRWTGEEVLVTDDLAKGLQACVAVLSVGARIKHTPERFQQALADTMPLASGRVLATFSGLGHGFRVTVTDAGYAMDAVSAFVEHELFQSDDLDAMVRGVPELVARRRPRPAMGPAFTGEDGKPMAMTGRR